MGIDWEDILDAEGEYLADAYEADAYEPDPYKAADKALKAYEADKADAHKASRYTHADQKDYCAGIWRGTNVRFKKTFGDHTFTEEECAKLLADEVIEFSATANNGKKYTAKGKLDYSRYKGHTYVGFNLVNSKNYCSGTWRGINIRFKKTFSDHTFTEEECAKLLADEVIEFPVTVRTGTEYTVKGKLKDYEYNGHKYVSFKVSPSKIAR